MTASVRVFIGLTKKDYLKKNLGVLEIYRSVTNGEDTYDKEKYYAAEIFIHPDLQTSEVWVDTVLLLLENFSFQLLSFLKSSTVPQIFTIIFLGFQVHPWRCPSEAKQKG